MGTWEGQKDIRPQKYRCAHCDAIVATNKGYYRVQDDSSKIYICPNCDRPTYFRGSLQFPAPLLGNQVGNLHEPVESLYNEIRACTGVGAYTACILACRKLLMHISVDKGAAQGLTFFEYVDFLDSKGYVPPDGKEWVNHIRSRSNEANHEIVLMTQEDAQELMGLIEMLLKFIYEFPGKFKKQ